jgi:hypothetical protein
MKCLFDNNLPPKLAKALNYLEGDDGITVEHLKEKFPVNTPDTQWIVKLGKEGEWFVITKDNQIRKKPHEIKAWKETHIPIVFLQRSWTNYGFWEQSWRLIKYWQNLKDTIEHNKKAKSFVLTVNGKITPVG